MPLELKRGHVTACRTIPHVDFSQPSVVDIEGRINVSHQLRALLLDLVNKRMNTNTCNKPSMSCYCNYVVRQMTFRTHCIALKMTYDMRGLTRFRTCETNIIPFFLLDSCWVLLLRRRGLINYEG